MLKMTSTKLCSSSSSSSSSRAHYASKWKQFLVSPLSFNCYSEQVMRESADELSWTGVTVSSCTLNNLRYVDDIVLHHSPPTVDRLS